MICVAFGFIGCVGLVVEPESFSCKNCVYSILLLNNFLTTKECILSSLESVRIEMQGHSWGIRHRLDQYSTQDQGLYMRALDHCGRG